MGETCWLSHRVKPTRVHKSQSIALALCTRRSVPFAKTKEASCEIFHRWGATKDESHGLLIKIRRISVGRDGNKLKWRFSSQSSGGNGEEETKKAFLTRFVSHRSLKFTRVSFFPLAVFFRRDKDSPIVHEYICIIRPRKSFQNSEANKRLPFVWLRGRRLSLEFQHQETSFRQ